MASPNVLKALERMSDEEIALLVTQYDSLGGVLPPEERAEYLQEMDGLRDELIEIGEIKRA